MKAKFDFSAEFGFFVCLAVLNEGVHLVPLKQQHDLHTYMDQMDLAQHFGVSSPSEVPLYDLTTPSYHEAYLDFPLYAQKADWVYPAKLEFDITAFNRKYTVDAYRNDRLISPEFSVKFYDAESSDEGGRTYFVDRDVYSKHYLAKATDAFAEENFDAADNGEDVEAANSAFSISRDGMRGLIQAPDRLLRVVPVKRHFARKFAAYFDMKENDLDLATHIVFEVSQMQHLSTSQEKVFQFEKKKKKKKRLKASMKLGVLVDYSVYEVMKKWGFSREEDQIFYIISFYNDVQLMYKERTLWKKVKLTIALQSVGFFTQEKNDLGASEHAEQYLDNVCAGPYNNIELDQIQTLTYLDIYDVNSKRLLAYDAKKTGTQLDLPQPFKFPGGLDQPKRHGHIAEGQRLNDCIGLAWIGTTCQKRKHCSIVELNTAIPSFSAAHEIGHSIGVHHEEDSSCPFEAKDPSRSSFMSSVSWSGNAWATKGITPQLTKCAIKELKTAVKGQSNCLLKDEPDRVNPSLEYKTALKAVVQKPIDPSNLCNFLFGEFWLVAKKWRRQDIKEIFASGSRVGDEMCQAIECRLKGVKEPRSSYSLKFGPALPGTVCDPRGGKACYNFKCVDASNIPFLAAVKAA